MRDKKYATKYGDPYRVQCVECGKEFVISDRTYRRKIKYKLPFVCSSCNTKIQIRNQTPEEKERLKKLKQDAWNKKSDEEKARRAELTRQQVAKRTKEEQDAYNKIVSDNNKKRWATMSENDRKNVISNLRCANKEWLNSLSYEQKEELNRQKSERQIKVWNNKSEDQRSRDIAVLRENNSKFRNNLTEEKRLSINHKISSALNDYISNMGEEEFKLRMHKLGSDFRNWWDRLSESEYDEICKKRSEYYKNLSPGEKELYRLRSLEAWNKLSDSDKNLISERERKRWENKSQEEKNLISERERKRWENKSQEEKDAASERSKYYWEIMSPEEKIRLSNLHKEWWSGLTPTERQLRSQKQSISEKNFWDNLSGAEKSKMLANKTTGNRFSSLNDKFDIYFESRLSHSGFRYEKEFSVYASKKSHSWDYAIFDSNDMLVCLVDLDGAYYHADICDYDGLRSHRSYDVDRGETIPIGTKWCIIQELKFDDCFDWLEHIINMNYAQFVNEFFRYLRAMPCPFPSFSTDELLKSLSVLKRFSENKSYCTKLLEDNRLGDRISMHFHQSMWRGVQELWKDDSWLKEEINSKRIINNHLNKNKILQAYTPNFISVGNALLIVERNLSQYKEIFNPKETYSSILLAAVMSGKTYSYLSENDETNSLIAFFGLQNVASVNTSKNHECMFTEVESYTEIKPLLDEYECSSYVFIVENPGPYSEFVTDHYGSENVILL